MSRYVALFLWLIIILSGCVGQAPAPIEYNHSSYISTTSEKPLKSKPIPVVKSKHTKPSENDEEKIISKQLEQRDKEGHTTGYLKEPKTLRPNADSDNIASNDTIIVPPVNPDNMQTIYHEVQDGETLESIATNYDQDIDALAKLNNLTPPYTLQPSEIIKIKVSKELLNKKNRQNVVSNEPKMLPKEDLHKTSNLHFTKPVEGKVITKFGTPLARGKSNGINIEAADGSSIKSIASGTVIFTGRDAEFGNLVIVKLSNSDLYVAYAHMQNLILEKGAEVKQGEIIGYVGRSGNVKFPQLHFAIREGKIAVDPLKYVQY